jgi:hypothetical protein
VRDRGGPQVIHPRKRAGFDKGEEVFHRKHICQILWNGSMMIGR